jgi:hypothetical protein
MVYGYVPPPPPVPAEIRTIDANQQERLESPEQSMINNINQGHYGDRFSASLEKPEQTQPDKNQQMQDLNNTVEDIGKGGAALADAKNRAEQRKDEDAAITGNRDVAAGTGGEPPPDPEGAAGKAASGQGFKTMPDQDTAAKQESSPSESSGESADKGLSNDRGDYDYYNGIM